MRRVERSRRGAAALAPPQEAPAYRCATCGFELWRPLADFGDTVLGLYDDARFPGRCIVALSRHVYHFDELEDDEVASLMQSAARVGAAVRKAVGADRVNYAVLGNTQPHVHVHVIPRVHATDPVPARPPWEHPEPPSPLDAERRDAISRAILEELR